MKLIGRFLLGIIYFVIIVLSFSGIGIFTMTTLAVNYLKIGISMADAFVMFIALPVITIRILIRDVIWPSMKTIWFWVLTGTVQKVEA